MRTRATLSATAALVAIVLVGTAAVGAIPTPDSGPAAGGTEVTVPVPGADSFIQIAAGDSHSLALDADGNLWTWGSDLYGQVGNGATTGDVTTPAEITAGTTYTHIAAGYGHSLAIDADGNLWAWGRDHHGQVGNGAPTSNVTAPAQITTGTTYTHVAAGAYHSLALDADGNLWTWGYDGDGQVGNGATTGDVTTPAEITTGTTYTNIAAGYGHSLAIDADGNLWTWGWDYYGQVGNGTPTGNVTAPAQITTGTTYTHVASGAVHSLALDADGNLWTWGYDGDGRVGNGAPTGDVTAPAQVTTDTTYTTVAAGYYHSLALDADGNLWAWGNDNDGQVGNGAPTGDVTAPAQITSEPTYTHVAGGAGHSLAIDADGNLWAWGDDDYGQVGNGAPTGDVTAPAQITSHTTYTRVAAGGSHSLALDADGNLWAWGNDDYGQVGKRCPHRTRHQTSTDHHRHHLHGHRRRPTSIPSPSMPTETSGPGDGTTTGRSGTVPPPATSLHPNRSPPAPPTSTSPPVIPPRRP